MLNRNAVYIIRTAAAWWGIECQTDVPWFAGPVEKSVLKAEPKKAKHRDLYIAGLHVKVYTHIGWGGTLFRNN